MSTEDWDNLFALAEGKPNHNKKPRLEEPSEKSSALIDPRAALLQSRNAIIPFVEAGLGVLGVSFDVVPQNGGGTRTSAVCRKWKGSDRICRRCHRTEGAHVWTVLSNDDHDGVIVACALRNLRCWCRHQALVLNPARMKKNDITRTKDIALDRTILTQQQSLLTRHSSYLPESVSDPCRQAAAMIAAMRIWDTSHNDSSKGNDKRLHSYWEALIRGIMACDDAYYKLYYWHISAIDPSTPVVHPYTYFGGWDDNDAVSSSRADNILATLHRLRHSETIVLFQPWTKCSESRQELREIFAVLPSNDPDLTLDQRHATVAPRLLSEWRDSCRDFLCHLYAYATISNDTLERLEPYVMSRGVTDVGAGTGYWGSVLAKRGVSVKAYDVAPGSDNEYHASVPSFMMVRRAKATTTVKKKRALLLCYPPPEDPMALEALQGYRGDLLVHIGEFKGLTGSEDFESLLTSEFECLERWPCLHWGTDASYITVWRRTKETPNPPSILLPCRRCGVRESKKRCRLARAICYCSRDCCIVDTGARQLFLEQQCMIVFDDLNFDNPRHFSTLQ